MNKRVNDILIQRILKMSNEITTALDISFSIDYLKILSAKEDDVILECQIDNSDSSNRCVVILKRKMFHDIIDSWLDVKKRYFEVCNGGFAGVGSIYFTKYKKKRGNVNLLIDIRDDEDIDKWEAKYENVPVYEALEYETDMEHG